MYSATSGVAVQAARDRSHQVALGHDARELPAVEDEHRSDVALDHPLSDPRDRLARFDAEQIARHVVADHRHPGNSMGARARACSGYPRAAAASQISAVQASSGSAVESITRW